MLSETVMAGNVLGCRATSWLDSQFAIIMFFVSRLLSPDCLRFRYFQVHLWEHKLLHATWFFSFDMPCKITICKHASNSYIDLSDGFFKFWLFYLCTYLGAAERGQIVTWTLSCVVSSVLREFSVKHREKLASRAWCLLTHALTFWYVAMQQPCLFIGAASFKHVIASADAMLDHRQI